MFLNKLMDTRHNKHMSDNALIYLAHILLFFAIIAGMTAVPSNSYGLDYGETKGKTMATHHFSQGDVTAQQKFGDRCAHYLNDKYNFDRNLDQRKLGNYGDTQGRATGIVIGFSIALGPDTVIDDNENRLRFDMANADTMNGPLSGFAAYRDCRTQNILHKLQ